jgi:hypothetical protein
VRAAGSGNGARKEREQANISNREGSGRRKRKLGLQREGALQAEFAGSNVNLRITTD